MSLVPIKLIENVSVRNKLLKIKDETPDIDKNDYIESQIETNMIARNLLAIEDASEIAKHYLHKKGFFERFAKDIKKKSGKDFGFSFHKTDSMKRERSPVVVRKGVDYILMEHSYPDGSGHYGMARVNHDDKTALIYDSMTDTDSVFVEPLRYFMGRRYKVSMGGFHPQPTGGFVSQSFDDFKTKTFVDNIEDAFIISQYDELSQHHFCYMESFLAMMTDIGMVGPGPKDPRERLAYIKEFIWDVIHAYVPKSSRKTVQWGYFEKYFPYILESMDIDGNRLPMQNGKFQLPTVNGITRFKLKKIIGTKNAFTF
jgi:hypothetical protein